MTSEYGASVLVHVLRDVKRQGGRVTASHGEMLAAMDPQDLQLLQAASELAAKRAVTRVTATPSGRSFFRIHSLNRFRSRNGESERVANDGISQPFDPSMASETQPNYYNCFEHYCSCLHFHDEVVKNPVAMVRDAWIDCTGEMQWRLTGVRLVQAHGRGAAGGRDEPARERDDPGRRLCQDAMSARRHRSS